MSRGDMNATHERPQSCRAGRRQTVRSVGWSEFNDGSPAATRGPEEVQTLPVHELQHGQFANSLVLRYVFLRPCDFRLLLEVSPKHPRLCDLPAVYSLVRHMPTCAPGVRGTRCESIHSPHLPKPMQRLQLSSSAIRTGREESHAVQSHMHGVRKHGLSGGWTLRASCPTTVRRRDDAALPLLRPAPRFPPRGTRRTLSRTSPAAQSRQDPASPTCKRARTQLRTPRSGRGE